MKIRHTTSSGDSEVELQMTPMIDIVFQLLIFFIMTFKIVVQEGDFNVKMPKALGPGRTTFPRFVVNLKSDQYGNLNEISIPSRTFPLAPPDIPLAISPSATQKQFRQTVLAAFAQVREEVKHLVGKDTGPDSLRENVEAVIAADDQLHYVYIIDAVTHISGFVEDKHPVKLIQNIKFKPPQKQPGG